MKKKRQPIEDAAGLSDELILGLLLLPLLPKDPHQGSCPTETPSPLTRPWEIKPFSHLHIQSQFVLVVASLCDRKTHVLCPRTWSRTPGRTWEEEKVKPPNVRAFVRPETRETANCASTLPDCELVPPSPVSLLQLVEHTTSSSRPPRAHCTSNHVRETEIGKGQNLAGTLISARHSVNRDLRRRNEKLIWPCPLMVDSAGNLAGSPHTQGASQLLEGCHA